MIVSILRIASVIGIVLGMGYLMKDSSDINCLIIFICGGLPILVLLGYDF